MPNNTSKTQSTCYTAKKRVSFGGTQTIHFYRTSDNTIDTLLQHCRQTKYTLSRERGIQQLITRRAVISYRRYLRQSRGLSSRQDDEQDKLLANMICKFSRRSKELALEAARLNYLAAYGDTGGELPQFSPDNDNLKVDAPVQVSQFPSIKLRKKRASDKECFIFWLTIEFHFCWVYYFITSQHWTWFVQLWEWLRYTEWLEYFFVSLGD